MSSLQEHHEIPEFWSDPLRQEEALCVLREILPSDQVHSKKDLNENLRSLSADHVSIFLGAQQKTILVSQSMGSDASLLTQMFLNNYLQYRK
jgi:hypothetical protein